MISGKSGIRFSLRTKVLLTFLSTVAGIMLLSNYLYYLANKNLLIANLIRTNQFLTSRVNDEVDEVNLTQSELDTTTDDKLRSAAITLEYAMGSKVQDISNESLTNLADQLGISGFSLFQLRNGYAVVIRSSDPKEIYQRFKTIPNSPWTTAFTEVAKDETVDVSIGTSYSHFWVGPWSKDKVDPSETVKYGYYHDGSTDYIVDPFELQTQTLSPLKPNETLNNLVRANKYLLAIVGINPLKFDASPKLTESTDGSTYVDLSDEGVIFGTYQYADSQDASAVSRAYKDKSTITSIGTQNGRKLIKTFVYQGRSYNNVPYVTEIVTDYQLIENVLHEELQYSIRVSILVMIAVFILSFISSGYILKPLQRITKKVDEMAQLNFEGPVEVHRSDELGDLAKSVNVMRENLLENLYRATNDKRNSSMKYLGMISTSLIHELKTPVVTIRYLIGLIHRFDAHHEKFKEALNHIEASAIHLTSVIDTFNSYIKNGKLTLESTDIAQFVLECMHIFRPTADQAGIHLHFENLIQSGVATAKIDVEKLRMVILNLLRNGMDAMKNAPDKQLVLTLKQVCSEIVIDVVDRGAGIPEPMWTKIFMPFQSDKKSGAGLGLALSALIVLSHGGNIFVAKSSKAGTTMRITFQASESAAIEKQNVHDTGETASLE